MTGSTTLPAVFQQVARNHQQGEVLFMVDRTLSAETAKQLNEFIQESGLACKTSAAYFGMYYDIEPFDIKAPTASTGHHWNMSEEALPALDGFRRAYRDGQYQKPLHVIFICQEHTLGNVENSKTRSFIEATRRELKTLVANHPDVTFDGLISKDAETLSPSSPTSIPCPIALHNAGDKNENFQRAIMDILMPHINADLQKQAKAGTESAKKLAGGLTEKITVMKPLRIQKRP